MLKWVAMRSTRMPVRLAGMPGQPVMTRNFGTNMSRTLRLMECMEQGITIDADVDKHTGHLFDAYKAHAQKQNCNITVA